MKMGSITDEWVEERKRRIAAAYAEVVELEMQSYALEQRLDAARRKWETLVFESRPASSSLACSACGGKPIQSQWSTGKFYIGCNRCHNKTPPGGTKTAAEAWRLWNEINTPNVGFSDRSHAAIAQEKGKV
jgi:hypothetical protein